MARITLDKVEKSFGNVSVIKQVDLDINDGELMVLETNALTRPRPSDLQASIHQPSSSPRPAGETFGEGERLPQACLDHRSTLRRRLDRVLERARNLR